MMNFSVNSPPFPPVVTRSSTPLFCDWLKSFAHELTHYTVYYSAYPIWCVCVCVEGGGVDKIDSIIELRRNEKKYYQ